MELKLNRLGFGYGAFPSKPNPNDLGFPSHLVVRTGDFPVRAFLTGSLPPVKNQGQQGSCTAHGSTSLGERLYRRWKGITPVFSPAYIYYQERSLEGTLGQGDTGAAVSSSLVVADPKAFKEGGWCLEGIMPYNDSDLTTAPSSAAIASAAMNPGGSFHSLGNNIANIKSCILSDYSFVIGISVYDSFESDEAAASGLIPYPNLGTEQLQGGHETHAGIGFDDTIVCPNSPNPGAVLCQNSWDTSWGCVVPGVSESTRGYYWLSYDFLMNPSLTSDIRMAHLGGPWGAKALDPANRLN